MELYLKRERHVKGAFYQYELVTDSFDFPSNLAESGTKFLVDSV